MIKGYMLGLDDSSYLPLGSTSDIFMIYYSMTSSVTTGLRAHLWLDFQLDVVIYL